MKNSGKPFNRVKFSSSKGDRKESKKKYGKDSQSPQGIMCYECNGHGHLKKECPNYLRGKGKTYATTLSDSDSLNSDSKESCDGEGNYSAFMTITHNESSEDLNLLVQELGDHSDEESNAEEDENTAGLQENYHSLLEKLGKYTRNGQGSRKEDEKGRGGL